MVFALALGCGANHGIDRFEVARTIQNSDAFREPLLASAPSRVADDCSRAAAEVENWRQWSTLGIIELHPTPASPGCEAVLSEDALRVVRGVSVRPDGNAAPGRLLLPVAERIFVRTLTEAAADPDTTTIEFLWRWQPNRLGDRVGIDRRERRGKASFWRTEGVWRVTELSLGE